VSKRFDQIITEVAALRATQDRSGELTRPMGTGSPAQLVALKMTEGARQLQAFAGVKTWGDMLTTQCAKACAQTGPELREQLLNLAALAMAAVETMDRVAEIEADRD
jgi:hypothetical protein